jgi:hypothetical protein
MSRSPCLWFDDQAEQAVNSISRCSSGHDWERSRDMARQGHKCPTAERFGDDRNV